MIVAALILLVAAGMSSGQVPELKISPEAQTAIDDKSGFQWITFKVDQQFTLQLVHTEPMRLSVEQAREEYGEYEYAKREALDLFAEFIVGLPSNEALLTYFFFPVQKFDFGANPILLEWSPRSSPHRERVLQNMFKDQFLSKHPGHLPLYKMTSIYDDSSVLQQIFPV